MFPGKYGIIVVVPNHIVDWYEDTRDCASLGDALVELIEEYGGVPNPEKAEWEIEEDFYTNCKRIRLTSTEDLEGLVRVGSFCHFVTRNLDIDKIQSDIEN